MKILFNKIQLIRFCPFSDMVWIYIFLFFLNYMKGLARGKKNNLQAWSFSTILFTPIDFFDAFSIEPI